jgi:hypothetical protein
MIPGTILLVEKTILAVTVDDQCGTGCGYAITGKDLPASDKKGLDVILLSAYDELQAFLPSCLVEDDLLQYDVNNFLWHCWREQRDLLEQHLFNFTDVLDFPLRSMALGMEYDILFIHRYLNFLRDQTKSSQVPSWTGDQKELVKWLENQRWRIEIPEGAIK